MPRCSSHVSLCSMLCPVDPTAMTGDPISSREYYSLGALYEVPELCGALGSLFLGGGPGKAAEAPLDEEAVPVAGTSILLAANGFKAGQEIGPESNIRYPRPAVTLRPNVPARFQLHGGQYPTLAAGTSGQDPESSVPSLLQGKNGGLLCFSYSSVKAGFMVPQCDKERAIAPSPGFGVPGDNPHGSLSTVHTSATCRYPGASAGIGAALYFQSSSRCSRCSSAGVTSKCSA